MRAKETVTSQTSLVAEEAEKRKSKMEQLNVKLNQTKARLLQFWTMSCSTMSCMP